MKSKNPEATLLVSCPDRPGLVAALAQVLYSLGANILDSEQHVDPKAREFFQRIRFDQAEEAIADGRLRAEIKEVAERHSMRWRLVEGDRRKRVVIFVSKSDHCLYDLLLRWRSGEIACDVVGIVGNHRDLEPVADQFEVPFEHCPMTTETKAEVEAHELELLAELEADLVVLARYMQIVTEDFIERCPGALINIHQSFLPAFSGGNPYRQAYERGVKLIGATAHYVTADLDEGPIIEQDVVRSSHRDSVRDLARKGRDLERVVLARAVRAHLQDRVLTYGNKTVVFGS